MGKKKLKSKKEDNELYNHLEKCIGMMRGKISKGDTKKYLLPLIFYKRISDVYDEEKEIATEKYADTPELIDSPLIHRFIVPEGTHWNDIRNKTEDLGSAIVNAFMKIENANIDDLAGIFSNFDNTKWTDKQTFSDDLLKSIIEHISQIPLKNKDCSNDVIGQVYEYLMKHYADIAKTKAGEFYTPRQVINLMVRVLNPKLGEDIYDPACGTAGMLIEAFHVVGDSKATRGHLFGQESNPTTHSLGKINLFLHGAEEFEILSGDTFQSPRFLDTNGRLRQFDIVLANPPFSDDDWGIDKWPKDKYGRCIFGTPSENCGDYAWLQHMICSMKPHGRMAVVMPQGVLFKEKAIRKKLVESHKVETIVQLPLKLFYATGLSPCILFLKNDKTDDKIRFVDATDIYTKAVSRNVLTEEDVVQIIDLITGPEDIEPLSHTADIEEIKNNDWELTVSHYAVKPFVDTTPPMKDVLVSVKNLDEEMRNLESKIEALEKECGIYD